MRMEVSWMVVISRDGSQMPFSSHTGDRFIRIGSACPLFRGGAIARGDLAKLGRCPRIGVLLTIGSPTVKLLSLNQVAYLLGYEDANSFFRTFPMWEGASPGEWRCLHREADAGIRRS